jgi:D-tagatose-1,6-bisphosphate aldolase subunit GatZ/KbaZ
MTERPVYWKDYYGGTEAEQAFKRKFSLSDRARYYWTQPEVEASLQKLMHNLGDGNLPYSLASQYLGETKVTARRAIQLRIGRVLRAYKLACESAG